MARPRSETVSLETTSYYHVISRCVRQSFLCGKDKSSGKSYEHRRSWLEKRLLFLSTVFTIDLCAYGILHNHYHITLHLNAQKALDLSDHAVIERWHKLYKGTPLSQRFVNNEHLSEQEWEKLRATCNTWRARLHDLSWFMRCCNESIARRANKEDSCTGHFWDGRFKSIPILDYRALLATMVYNDLNSIKAGIASDIESSEFTSIKKRLEHQNSNSELTPGMAAFEDNSYRSEAHVLPFQFSEYLMAAEFTAKRYLSQSDKTNAGQQPALLKSLGLVAEQWTDAVIKFDKNFSGIVGTNKNIKEVCRRLNRHWMHGLANCKRCFDSFDQETNPLMSKMLAPPPKTQT